MTNKINEVIDQIQPSRPIFKLQNFLRDSHSQLSSYTATGYSYVLPTEGRIAKLLAHSYYERFDATTLKVTFNRQDLYNNILNKIKIFVCSFVEKSLQLKNPRQSKLYKWLYYMNSTNMPAPLHAPMIALYEYIADLGQGGFIVPDKDKRETLIALLQAMQEKYGDKAN